MGINNDEAFRLGGGQYVLPVRTLHKIDGTNCSKVSVSGVSAASGAMVTDHVIVTCDVPVFACQGPNPTALDTGVHEYLVDGVPHSVFVTPGYKLAFIVPSGGSNGVAYITPL